MRTSRMTCRMAVGLLVTLLSPAAMALNVFACEPEWASLASTIGGDRVRVTAATTPAQDPHYIQARPSLIAKTRRADLVVCTGAELEVGWLPLLLRKSGNSEVQPGQPGYLEAASVVELGGIPDRVDRSMGDVHAAGNPHFHTDPSRLLAVADALLERMVQLDGEGAALYRQNHADFSERWQQSMAKWQEKAAVLAGKRIITHHNYWFYLAEWLGFDDIAHLEPKPSVPPSVSHLSRLLQQYGDAADAIVRVSYSNPRAAQWFADRTGIPVVELPSTVNFNQGETLEQWFDNILSLLLDAAQRDLQQ